MAALTNVIKTIKFNIIIYLDLIREFFFFWLLRNLIEEVKGTEPKELLKLEKT